MVEMWDDGEKRWNDLWDGMGCWRSEVMMGKLPS